MFDEIKFVEATRKLVDCDYSLGDTSKGYDCLSMLLQVYREMGVIFPDEWNGWTEKNYGERWTKGEGRKELIQFLKELGTPIEINFIRKGDIIVFENGAGIYLGNGYALGIWEKHELRGGKVFPLRHFLNKIQDIRRLIDG